MTPLKLTCNVMVMMVTPSYGALLCLMKPGPGHTKLRRKHPHFLQNPPIILQVNARAHTKHPVTDLYYRWGWGMLFHPPHSLDLSSCDYNLIPKMKEPLCDMRFRTVPNILQALGRSIRNINRRGAATGIQRLPHC
ncbi:hypothetical protein C0J52_14378 [Blattella germanica]|nr:hypothetical protein C0J52_14378 [Blattella germanica]